MLAAPEPDIEVGQWQAEFLALLDIYQRLDVQNVLEVGTWQGGTLYYWLKYAFDMANVISLDKGPANWRPQVPGFNTGRWQAWAPEYVELHVIEADSHDPATLKRVKVVSPHLDFLFIDGDHSYAGAKADFELYGPLVRPGGLIAFHDLITPASQQHIEIRALWREIQRAGYKTRELYSHPGQEWGGIGVVYV